jgi:type IV secretory pathway TraG/TraD family ATPase VirD4
MGTLSTAGQYTRGSEVVSHYLAMFRASVARQTVLVLVAATAVGLGSVLLEMGDERSLLPAYFNAWSREGLLAAAEVELTGQQTIQRGDVPALASKFGGRSIPFMARQAALRAGCAFVLGWPVFALVLIAIGKGLQADRFLRGATLVDTTTASYRRRHVRRALTSVAVAGGVTAAVVPVMAAMGDVGGIARLVVAWLATVSESVAQILSPGLDGAAIWAFTGSRGALLPPQAAYDALAEHVGSGLPGLGGMAMVGALVGAAAGGGWSRRKRLLETPADPLALSLGGVVIARVCEVSHFLISGVTRVGKSVAIKRWLDTIRDRGQRAIVWDPKGEYTERYYRPGKDTILNPFDERSACWTPWADADDMAAYESMGRSLFPDDMSRDKFWTMGGALIFAWLVERVGKRLWGSTGRPMSECPYNQELAYVLNHTEMEELQEELAGSPAARYMSKNAAAMSQSFLGTLATNLSPFLYLRNLRDGERALSIREFIQDESRDSWIFISADPKRFDAVRPLVSLWYDLAINATLALADNRPDLPVEKHRRIFAVLDELASLQVLPALDTALTVGASKGLALILGLQSLEQMKDTYGHHKAMTMLGQPQNRAVLRTVESTTAKWLEEELGKREVERITESQQMGADAQRDGVGLAKQRQLESLVVYSEIQSLPKLTGYLSLAGEPIRKIRYTWSAPRGSEPGFVPTKTLPTATPPPWTRAKQLMREAEELEKQGDDGAALAKRRAASKLLDPEEDQTTLRTLQTGIKELERGAELENVARCSAQLTSEQKATVPASDRCLPQQPEAAVSPTTTIVTAAITRANSESGRLSPDLDLAAELEATVEAIELATGSDRDRLQRWAQELRGRVRYEAIKKRRRVGPKLRAVLASADAESGRVNPDLDLTAELEATMEAIELASGSDKDRLQRWAQELRGRVRYEAIKKRREEDKRAVEASVANGSGDAPSAADDAPETTTTQHGEASTDVPPSGAADPPQLDDTEVGERSEGAPGRHPALGFLQD